MSLTRINNQAVKLYTPTETTFNETESKCLWLEKYFQKATCDDISQIVLQSEVETTQLNPDPDLAIIRSGAVTSEPVNKLVDATADFDGSSGGVEVFAGMTVKNTDTDTFATIVSVDSPTQLTLDGPIMNLTDPNYTISYYEFDGNIYLNGADGKFEKSSGATGEVSLAGQATVGDFYYFQFNLDNFTYTNNADSITVKVGGQTAAIITPDDEPTGTIAVYGEALSDSDMTIEMSSNIAADISDFELYYVTKPSFQIVNCENEQVEYTSVDADVVASLDSAQVMLNVDWSVLLEGYDCPCGCYRVEILDASDPYSSVLFRTDCFEICDSFDCTVKLSGTNLDNAFGIDFASFNYIPVLRISGDLEVAEYKGDKENEENSNGVTTTLYFKSETERNLFIYAQPEHIHNFLRLLIGYDTFEVDDVPYIAKEASYSPENERISGKLLSLYNASTKLRLKNDLNENKYC